MSRQDRRGIGNGLWLCSTCAAKIDRNVDLYPAELLLSWKVAAEAQAIKEQGNRLPLPSDALDQVVMALTGNPGKFLPHAIANTHLATTIALEALDPRFKVKSQFIDGISHFELRPLEDAKFTARVTAETAVLWDAGLTRAYERGEVAELPMSGVTFTGSKLLEMIAEEGGANGKLTITPPNRFAILKLKLQDGLNISLSDEFPGKIYLGRQNLRFEGLGYGGLVKLELRMNRVLDAQLNCNLSFVPLFNVWAGREALALPYFDKLKALLDAMNTSASGLRFALEVDGLSVLTGMKVGSDASAAMAPWVNYMAYVARVRALARYLGKSIYVPEKLKFSGAEHMDLADVVDVFDGIRSYTSQELQNEPSTTFVSDDKGEQRAALERFKDYSEIFVVEPARYIRVFESDVLLPSREIRLFDVRPQKIETRATTEGREYSVKWEKGPNFRCVYKFLIEIPKTLG